MNLSPHFSSCLFKSSSQNNESAIKEQLFRHAGDYFSISRCIALTDKRVRECSAKKSARQNTNITPYGKECGTGYWRIPLLPLYDKLIWKLAGFIHQSIGYHIPCRYYATHR